MPRIIDPRRRCLPLAEWPELDRLAWEAALVAAKGRFSARGRAAQLGRKALEKVYDGYGRWLGFLRLQGWLDTAAPPAERPTPERAAAYFDALRAVGNRDYSITGRFQDLEAALSILVPRMDFHWLQSPGGVPLRRQLAMEKRTLVIHDIRDLFDWGLELMERAITLAGPRRRQVMLRDGLMIALLASRGMRLRSLLALRLGDCLRHDGAEWWITLETGDIKNKRTVEYPLTPRLTPWLERYLTTERVELLDGATQDALWINWGGKPLGEAGVEKRIRWLSVKQFGAGGAFGPHHFRYCIATTVPLLLSETPGAGAALLGITKRIFEEHYDRGKRAAAGGRYQKGLAESRHQSAPLAQEAFEALGRSLTSRNRTRPLPPMRDA